MAARPASGTSCPASDAASWSRRCRGARSRPIACASTPTPTPASSLPMWCWTRASGRALAPIALSLVAAAVALPARADDAAAPPGFAVAVLVVTLNRQPQREPIVALRDARGAVFVGATDFAQWRLRIPDSTALVHLGERYYPIAARPGLVASVRESEQALVIEAPAALFPATPIDVGAA